MKEWRQNWYFVQAGSLSPHLLVPTAPNQDEALLPIIRRFTELRNNQVTCTMITGDFVQRGIAPLQRRSQPLWETRQEMGA